MARRVFFAFHYQHDIWRAQRVRNSWVTHPDRESAGFFDASLHESAKTTDDDALKRKIRQGMVGSSVTAVLIGTHTAERKYVRYEIRHSVETGKALLGIRIHDMNDQYGGGSPKGDNPFELLHVTIGDRRFRLSDLVSVYSWVGGDGYENLGTWVEQAFNSKSW